jgi:dienelactone hydrolase
MKFPLILAALVCALGSSAASAQSLEVSPDHVLVDEVAVIRASGLLANERVSIQAELTDGAGVEWKSEAEFIADAQGVVDTSKQAPVKGSYDEISAMGLVWSMKPGGKGVKDYRPPHDPDPQDIQFHLVRNGNAAAAAQLEQRFMADGVTATKVEGAVRGVLFLPAAPGPHPGVLVVGGSEGGLPSFKAAWLASHGYAAFALAYFRYEDLPRDLAGIPLEYFGAALAWMIQRPEILSDQIAVMGTSRGGELALQLGSMYPQIKAVVAYVPANVRYPACCGSTAVPYAWTWRSQPLAYLSPRMAINPWEDQTAALTAAIPVEATHGPILLISGGEDGVWDSTLMADGVVNRLKQTHFAYHVEVLKYAHAGHRAGRPELVPAWHSGTERSASGAELEFGGSVKGDAESSLDAIPKVLEFLGQSLQAPPPKQ